MYLCIDIQNIWQNWLFQVIKSELVDKVIVLCPKIEIDLTMGLVDHDG